eukprot:CAMPEP_0113543098 /NCGR_PEP_ID=MMETSP0015_2-20120614/9976_1 /TAXON_ID=2838 /ORGANISM="Odontella" /LENGTH=262 /DNA_ID=CAMNT_0000443233 /DNA_START=63 /DNA_END=848 /DNA_ORIENTATION=- /assembly_acc=CAM_ASM_000160
MRPGLLDGDSAASCGRQPVLISRICLLAAAAVASTSSVALAFSSSSPNASNNPRPSDPTNADNYLNNYLDSVDSPRPSWLTADPQKPQPEEPLQPWGVQSPPPASSDAQTAETAAAEEAVATQTKEEEGKEDALTDAARYLDSHGSTYVDSLAEGRKAQKRSSAAPAAGGDAADGAESSPSSGEEVSRLESLLAAREAEVAAKNSELAAMREEHRAVKAAAADLLRRYYDLAEGLDEVEGALAKCADSFPDPDEGGLESYEW